MERKQETATIKKALKQAGFDKNDIKVSHGTGTAREWLSVHAKVHHKPECSCYYEEWGVLRSCPECKILWLECHDRILEVTCKATERDIKREYNDRVNVEIGFYDIGEV